MKQTAVEWLVSEIKRQLITRVSELDLHSLEEQAKAIEKEHIKNAFASGQEQAIAEAWLYDDAHPKVEEKAFMTFEQYYNETYNK